MGRADFLDPRWQKFRLERLQQADWKCEHCGESGSTLHVHHVFYVGGRKPWEYLPETTLVLCYECHTSEHEFTTGELLDYFGHRQWEYEVAEYVDVRKKRFQETQHLLRDEK